MKKILGILVSLSIAMIVFQDCQKSDFSIITGVVRDSLTNLPIEGAYIITQDGHSVKSANNGSYTIEGFKPGKVLLRVETFGIYHEKLKSLFISNDRVTKVDFVVSSFTNIETGRVTNTTLHTATITGTITFNPDISVYQYGHCWSHSTNFPTLEQSDDYTTYSGGAGEFSFTSDLTGLVADNIYYVRAYAKTNAGIKYGNLVVFRADLAISNGLLSYFPFNGDYYDQSGSGLYMYGYHSGLTTDRFGNTNCAISCSAPYYTYSYSSIYTTINEFSVSFWFYKNSWSGIDRAMISTGYPFYTNEVRIDEDASPNKIYFSIITGSGTTYKVQATSPPSLNVWHHVVAQRNSTSIELYIDGALQGSADCDNQPINNPWGYFFAGFDLKGSWTYFTGLLDDIRFYNRPLTNTEIQYLKKN